MNLGTSSSVDKSAPLDITLQRPTKVKKATAPPTGSTIIEDASVNLEPAAKRSRLEDLQALRNRVNICFLMHKNLKSKKISVKSKLNLETVMNVKSNFDILARNHRQLFKTHEMNKKLSRSQDIGNSIPVTDFTGFEIGP